MAAAATVKARPAPADYRTWQATLSCGHRKFVPRRTDATPAVGRLECRACGGPQEPPPLRNVTEIELHR